MTLNKVPDNLVKAAALLKALANESRLLILCVLRHQGEKNVTQLEDIVGLSQSALSQHLARLRKDSLVITRRDAQTIYYSVSKTKADCILDAICSVYGPSSIDENAV